MAGDDAQQVTATSTYSAADPATDSIVVKTDDGKSVYVQAPQEPAKLPSLQQQQCDSEEDSKNLSQFRQTLVSQIQKNTRIFIIVSVLSGTQLAGSFARELLVPLLEILGLAQDRYQLVNTRDANTVTAFAKETLLNNANDGIPQLIILLSGDGGIVDIINALAPRSHDYLAPQVSLIPMGTGNALANSSGLTDATWGLSALARGQAKTLPTFKATFSPGARVLINEAKDEEPLPGVSDIGHPYLLGAVVCSWGMHAGLVADSDTAEYRKFGVDRFKMAANEALHPADGGPPHAYKADVSIWPRGASDWVRVARDEHAYVLTTLVSSLEKGFTISPASRPLDSSLRIVHFGPMPGDEIMALMTRAYQGGKHVDEPTVSYQEVERVRIAFAGLESDSRWRRVCVDGKIIRVESDGWVEVEKYQSPVLSLRTLS